LQAALQHNPSAQNPEAQSSSFAHTAPRGLGPQLPLTQVTPGAQSAFDRQSPKQALAVASQLYGAQTVAGPGLQRPRPSHTLTSCKAAPAQVPGLQIFPAGCLRQAPLPSHLPSRPQVATADSTHWPATDGAPPAGTAAQMPGESATLHAMQVSRHAVLQHRPSTQKPL
jgi:hypothetical protein